MDATEFMQWRIYGSMEPLADERFDIHVARMLSMVANIYRDSSKAPKPFPVGDFMPPWQPSPMEQIQPQPVEKQLATMLLLQEIQNLTIDNQNR